MAKTLAGQWIWSDPALLLEPGVREAVTGTSDWSYEAADTGAEVLAETSAIGTAWVIGGSGPKGQLGDSLASFDRMISCEYLAM